jgi:hypothetical protein
MAGLLWRILGKIAASRGPSIEISSPRLGVLNLIGDPASGLISEDLGAFGRLFGTPAQSSSAPPRCDVLLVYAHIDESGKIVGADIGLREIIRNAVASIAIVASENTGSSYTAGTRREGFGYANLVMTLARNGDAFPRFFARLFEMMFAGETMPVAWVRLAPQVPGSTHPGTPGTIFAAEIGQLTFR